LKERKFEVWVKQHKKVKTEKGTKFTVKLQSPNGDTVVLIGDSEAIYEGLPIGHTVTVKIVDMQTTLGEGD